MIVGVCRLIANHLHLAFFESIPEVRVLPSTGITRLLRCRVGGGALARWPPSAAQTARAVFPHAAFTKARISAGDAKKESAKPS